MVKSNSGLDEGGIQSAVEVILRYVAEICNRKLLQKRCNLCNDPDPCLTLPLSQDTNVQPFLLFLPLQTLLSLLVSLRDWQPGKI